MNVRKASGWLFLILGALSFLFASVGKFSGQPMMKAEFALFGLPLAFMYVVAAGELAGALLLLTAYRKYGAIVLTVVALGAAFEHLTHGQFGMAIAPLVLCAIAWLGVSLHDGAKKPLANATA